MGVFFARRLISYKFWDRTSGGVAVCGVFIVLYIESANIAQSLHMVVMKPSIAWFHYSLCADSACKKHHTVVFFTALPNELRSSDNSEVVRFKSHRGRQAKRKTNPIGLVFFLCHLDKIDAFAFHTS